MKKEEMKENQERIIGYVVSWDVGVYRNGKLIKRKKKVGMKCDTHEEAVEQAKRILDENKECDSVEISTWSEGRKPYCKKVQFVTDVEIVKKEYKIERTQWYLERFLYEE